jgi:hypothetical protein
MGKNFLAAGRYLALAQYRLSGSAEVLDLATLFWAPIREVVLEKGTCHLEYISKLRQQMINPISWRSSSCVLGLSGSLATLAFSIICNLACTDAELSSSLNLTG